MANRFGGSIQEAWARLQRWEDDGGAWRTPDALRRPPVPTSAPAPQGDTSTNARYPADNRKPTGPCPGAT